MNPMKRAMFVLTAISMFVMVADVEAGLIFGRRSRGGNCSSGSCGTGSCGTGSSCGVGGSAQTFSEARPDSLSSTTVRAARVGAVAQPVQLAAKVTSPSGFKWDVAPSRLVQSRVAAKKSVIQVPNLDAKSLVVTLAVVPDLDIQAKPVTIAQIPDLDAPTDRPLVIGNLATR